MSPKNSGYINPRLTLASVGGWMPPPSAPPNFGYPNFGKCYTYPGNFVTVTQLTRDPWPFSQGHVRREMEENSVSGVWMLVTRLHHGLCCPILLNHVLPYSPHGFSVMSRPSETWASPPLGKLGKMPSKFTEVPKLLPFSPTSLRNYPT